MHTSLPRATGIGPSLATVSAREITANFEMGNLQHHSIGTERNLPIFAIGLHGRLSARFHGQEPWAFCQLGFQCSKILISEKESLKIRKTEKLPGSALFWPQIQLHRSNLIFIPEYIARRYSAATCCLCCFSYTRT